MAKLHKTDSPLQGGWARERSWRPEGNKRANLSGVREHPPRGNPPTKMRLRIFLSFKPSWSVGSPSVLSLAFLDWSLPTSPSGSPAYWLQSWGRSSLCNHVSQLFIINLFQHLLLVSSLRKPQLMLSPQPKCSYSLEGGVEDLLGENMFPKAMARSCRVSDAECSSSHHQVFSVVLSNTSKLSCRIRTTCHLWS